MVVLWNDNMYLIKFTAYFLIICLTSNHKALILFLQAYFIVIVPTFLLNMVDWAHSFNFLFFPVSHWYCIRIELNDSPEKQEEMLLYWSNCLKEEQEDLISSVTLMYICMYVGKEGRRSNLGVDKSRFEWCHQYCFSQQF